MRTRVRVLFRCWLTLRPRVDANVTPRGQISYAFDLGHNNNNNDNNKAANTAVAEGRGDNSYSKEGAQG
jgi:hypothetical protein